MNDITFSNVNDSYKFGAVNYARFPKIEEFEKFMEILNALEPYGLIIHDNTNLYEDYSKRENIETKLICLEITNLYNQNFSIAMVTLNTIKAKDFAHMNSRLTCLYLNMTLDKAYEIIVTNGLYILNDTHMLLSLQLNNTAITDYLTETYNTRS